MRNLASALLAAVLLTGCATTPRAAPTATTMTTNAQPADAAETAFEGRPQLRVSVRAPAVVPYRPEALGISGEYVTIRLTNTSSEHVAVDHLHAVFSATREGVEFPCEEHVGGASKVHEPAFLEQGQSFTFERGLDCTMPLPGLYRVRAYVHFGADTGPSRAPRNLVGSFDLQLASAGKHAQPYPSRDGLYAIMTGTPLTGPAAADNLAKSGYEVVIALINGAPQPSRVGSFHFSYLVYREADPLPCSGESETFAGPAYLAPGRVHIVKSRVACVLAVEGHYVVVGKLVIEHEGEGIEIGRLNFAVTRDPSRRDPLLFVPYP